jgi:glutamate dehydrogenase
VDTGSQHSAASGAQALIARIEQGSWKGFKAGGGITADARAFLQQMGLEGAQAGFAGLMLDDYIATIHDFWVWGEKRPGDAQLMRLRPAAGADGRDIGRDLLEVIGPDMPFLVDSLMGVIIEQGLEPIALFHPIVPVRRDAAGRRALVDGAESMIQIHFPPLVQAKAEALAEAAHAALSDVAVAVRDFDLIRKRMNDCAGELLAATSRVKAPQADMREAAALLQWIEGGKFVALGARDYRFPRDDNGEFIKDEPIILENTGLGILRDPSRYVLRRGSEPSIITPEIKSFLEEPTPLLIAKSSFASRVHRRVTADYIGVKRYATDGQVVGETRFVGLFTADAYNDPTREIPLLRLKTQRVIERAGALPGSHNARVLQNILETFPRDELFQIDEATLFDTATGILRLTDRPRVRLFVRRDRFNRFVSALVFVPKDRFNSQLRIAIGERLTAHYGGAVEAFYPTLGEGPLARIHYVVQDIDKSRPDPDIPALEAEIIALTRSWEDHFVESVVGAAALSEPQRQNIASRFKSAFGAGYREAHTVQDAIEDARAIAEAAADETVRLRAYPRAALADGRLRCKIYARGGPLPLSAMVPVLENMGLIVETEAPYRVAAADGLVFFMHDLIVRPQSGDIDLAAVESAFEDAFSAVWRGAADNDAFNRLILKLGVTWREAALMRALARFRTQTGLDPTPRVQEQALADHPEIAKAILDLFRIRFDPALNEPSDRRKAMAEPIASALAEALDKVPGLDADRALRRIAALVGAILRTNFYQRGPDGKPKAAMAFKIASRELADLPEPKPYREIWVFAPDVEGVHLRFGPVARGGLRWSDRRDDFRAEVLELVKAQQVKNAIIVPVGAKGGFFPKRLPARGAPGFAEAGQSAYVTFISALLDITDNFQAGKIAPPTGVVRWDGDDPYLVVAADKGTAAFSDLANSVAGRYGFWLGDAFASGGSVGYDHKAMGITARGAWEAVKRHFREMGRDIQSEPFTVIGVGDMSGDVFGNGMLLSRTIKLIAAFDHRDIFIDPNPADLDASWAERKRLFELKGSGWKDYSAGLISPGGGVFNRNEKAIPVSAELAALTGLPQAPASPSDIIARLIKAPCDLLWFGGIGNFIKASHESHADAGDKTNDAVRANAEDIRAKVIAEGANLGVTQAGRIAFARAGGRINTDAVDNSAGVDTSDHEVNIKILLTDAIAQGAVKPEDRDALLRAMTDEVAALVLNDNYEQTWAITLTEAAAVADLDSHERLMSRLEAAGKLDRGVEGLPSSAAMRALRDKGQGLTRPEIAKLLAYAKIDLFDAIVASPLPDDPHFAGMLTAYFPKALAGLQPIMARHRLRREIIATQLAGDAVDLGGPSFVDRIRETARVSAPTIARAFEAARQIFEVEILKGRIAALDNAAPASVQTELLNDVAFMIRRATIYLARKRGDASIAETIAHYAKGVAAQRQIGWDGLTPLERQRASARAEGYHGRGVPPALAMDIALLAPITAALDIVDVAHRHGLEPGSAALLYRAIGAGFGMDWLRVAGLGLSLEQHWDRLALRRTLEELFEDQRALAEHAIAWAKGKGQNFAALTYATAAAIADGWIATIGAPAAAPRQTLAELEAGGHWSFAKTVIAAAELRALTSALED